ncbi:MAG TPA: ABC transporter substrate binding protein, partial [Burkholderiaceae bacterium]|nr:ABC transporter substrate binding protein [Burkholderiaceae bacterium]
DELLRREQVEVLMAFGGEAAAAAARLTTTVPIVFQYAYLPIECGLIDSYAKPGRNCTGIALLAGSEVIVKRLEFLRAIALSARRVAYVTTDGSQLTLSGVPLNVWPGIAAAAKAQGFEHTVHFANRIVDVEAALGEAAAARAQAAMISGHSMVGAATRVAEFALRQRWVTATLHFELLEAGLLLYHGFSRADFNYIAERALQLVDRILRGANPAEIPVEIPTHMVLALNLKTARALGITLPQSLLLRADRVVE